MAGYQGLSSPRGGFPVASYQGFSSPRGGFLVASSRQFSAVIQTADMACSWKTKGSICCTAITLRLIIISVLSVIVAKHQAPIQVNGSNAYVRQISEVRNSLIQLDNRVNVSGVSLGVIVLLIVLLILARVTHHVGVKRPGKARKKVLNECKEERLLKVENILKAKGYMV